MRCLSQAMIPVPVALRAGLTDGYAWHQAIWHAFPGKPDARRDFLFRADRRADACRVLLLSAEAPASGDVFAWRTRDVGDAFLGHAVYRFQLKANPTMRRSADKRRLAIFDEGRLREWLERKAQMSGFAVAPETLSVGAPLAEVFVKNGRQGKHVSVDFEGVLRVIDRDAFTETFNNGIGSAKGFGYGLLMLQPQR
jgi:CRISPR system Cascade subunit CasE